jgi:condensin complex subunit 1
MHLAAQACKDAELKPSQFNEIMVYLMGFITKGAHSVALVEKLCYRFRTTQEVQQWRSFAHCLSLLQYTDKAVKKLLAQMPCFQDKLADEQVYNSFAEIIAKAKKFSSAEMKEVVGELEGRLKEIHEKGADDEAASKKASKASKRVKAKGGNPSKSSARGKGGGRARKALQAVPGAGNANANVDEDETEADSEDGGDSEDGDESEDDGGESEAADEIVEEAPAAKSEGRRGRKDALATKAAATKMVRSARRRQVAASDDDDDDDDLMI